MKDFEREKLQQLNQYKKMEEQNRTKNKKMLIIFGIILLIIAIIITVLLILNSIKATKDKKIKFENDLRTVYEKVLEEQIKKEEDYRYTLKGIVASSRSEKYEKLYSYVEQILNVQVNEDFYILTKEDLLILGLQNIEMEYLVSYQNKVVFATEPLIEGEKRIYTLDEILQNYEIKKAVDVSGANPPQLFEGMHPVIYNNDIKQWQIVEDTTNTSWYNYSEKMWANVMLSDYSDNNISNIDGSYYVWIPRFAYKINETNYHTNKSGIIDIKFLKDNTNIASDGTVIDENNTDAKIDYVIHPAFKFGKEITGIWVSKFEASNVDGNYKSLQDTYSWVNITLSEAFDISMEIKDNSIYGLNSQQVDTHLIKNTEWGAIAYLTHSKYGKNQNEVWINNYVDESGIKTGYAGRKADEINYGYSTVYLWNSNNGVRASTTGNTYGVYDLSGGASEKVAAYLDNNSEYLLTDGKSLYEEKDEKYYDKYYIGGVDTARNNYEKAVEVYGDAIYETSSSDAGNYAWYSDNSVMVTDIYCFFLRGGHIKNANKAGVFSFLCSSGGMNETAGFRSVITENTY